MRDLLGSVKEIREVSVKDKAVHPSAPAEVSLTCRNSSVFVQATEVSFNGRASLQLQLTLPAALNRQLSVDMANSYQFVLRKPAWNWISTGHDFNILHLSSRLIWK